MKAGRQLAMIMAAMMALGSPLTMFAQEIDATGGSGTGSADTNFSVDAETLGGGLVVLIPDEIVLEYNEGEEVFEKTSQITAKGFVEVDKHLEVSVPTDIEYALENFDAVTAAGTITFGIADGDNQVENWTQTELKTKDGDDVVGVAKDITVEVPESNVLDIGTYRAVISFNIELLGGIEYLTADNGIIYYMNGDDEFAGETYTVASLTDDASALADDGTLDLSTALASITDSEGNEANFNIIDENAFANNTEITSVKLNTSITEIRSGAFTNCTNLATVTYYQSSYSDISDFVDSGNVGTVADDAFTGTALTE